MENLPQTTLRRLKRIPQIPSVWEGDRRPLSGMEPNLEPAPKDKSDCIIWVDGSEGAVRAMDVVPPDMGQEAVVRTFLRAIENPHSPSRPARPQKIVVKNRQMQFFLRGALQDLDIAIDYVPELPLIDELFRSFEGLSGDASSNISSEIEVLLRETAESLWEDSPWDLLADHDIVAIEINNWDVGTLYACVMGMLGKEYGVILYRSLDSLKRFRHRVVLEDPNDDIEQAFLSQDCWFLNYEADSADFDLEDNEDEDEDFDLCELDADEIRPLLGSIHPYEGMRPLRDEEEAVVIYVALKALQLFFQESQDDLIQDIIPEISKQYKISLPTIIQSKQDLTSLTVKVSTLPQVASELLELSEEEEEDFDEMDFEFESFDEPVHEDLIPRDAYLSLERLPGQLLEQIKSQAHIQVQQPQDFSSLPLKETTKSIPIILIQTSRPKALELIKKLQAAGGLSGISFYPKINQTKDIVHLGIIKTLDGNLFSMGRINDYDPDYLRAGKFWKQICEESEGYCGLIVAMGITGSARGNPQVKDLMALFETKTLSI